MTDGERHDDRTSIDRAVSREMARRQQISRRYWILIAVLLGLTAILFVVARSQDEQLNSRIVTEVDRELRESVGEQVTQTIEERFVETLDEKAESVKLEAAQLQASEEIEEQQRQLEEQILLSRIERTAMAYRNFVADAGFDVRNSIPSFVFGEGGNSSFTRRTNAALLGREGDEHVFERACEATGNSLFRSDSRLMISLINRRLLCRFRQDSMNWAALTGEADCANPDAPDPDADVQPHESCEDATIRACAPKGDSATKVLTGMLEFLEDSIGFDETHRVLRQVLDRVREGGGSKDEVVNALEAVAETNEALATLLDETRIP